MYPFYISYTEMSVDVRKQSGIKVTKADWEVKCPTNTFPFGLDQRLWLLTLNNPEIQVFMQRAGGKINSRPPLCFDRWKWKYRFLHYSACWSVALCSMDTLNSEKNSECKIFHTSRLYNAVRCFGFSRCQEGDVVKGRVWHFGKWLFAL